MADRSGPVKAVHSSVDTCRNRKRLCCSSASPFQSRVFLETKRMCRDKVVRMKSSGPDRAAPWSQTAKCTIAPGLICPEKLSNKFAVGQ